MLFNKENNLPLKIGKYIIEDIQEADDINIKVNAKKFILLFVFAKSRFSWSFL